MKGFKLYLFVTAIVLMIIGSSFILIYLFYFRADMQARNLYEQGSNLLILEDNTSIADAVNYLTTVIVKYPNSKYTAMAAYKIAYSYELRGKYHDAAAKYKDILLKYSDDKDTYIHCKLRLAHIMFLDNQIIEAEDDLLALLREPNIDIKLKGEIKTELGYLYLHSKEYNKAKHVFAEALRYDGANDKAKIGESRALHNMGDTRYAMRNYLDFLEYDNTSKYSKEVKRTFLIQAYHKGIELLRAKDYKNARYFFSMIIKKYPGSREAENSLYWLGESYYDQKNYSQAIDAFRKTQLNKDINKDDDAQLKIGFSYFQIGNYIYAAKAFDRLINEFPTSPYVSRARDWRKQCDREIRYRDYKSYK